jgi:hypothetical protein
MRRWDRLQDSYRAVRQLLPDSRGIQAPAGRVQIIDNSIVTAYGIFAPYGSTQIVGNRIVGVGTGYGIYANDAGVIYKDNIVENVTTAYQGGTPVGSTNYP